MLRFIKNKIGKKSSISQLELVSIHIPKTAGTSFRHTLCKIYGKKHVLRLDIKENGDVFFNEKRQEKHEIPPHIKVIHGHFSYRNLITTFPIVKGIKVITWFREPGERVISNYHYLSSIWKQVLQEKPHLEMAMMNLHRSLLEYAADENNQNKISRFLDGIKLEDLFFIGLVSQYEKDMDLLAEQLNWKAYHSFNFNKTENKKRVKYDVTLDRIKQLNKADYEVYELAKKIRKGISSD
jgi:hypothetical protein